MENIFKKSINIVLLSLLFFSSTIITTPEQAFQAIALLSEEKYKPQSSFLFFGKSKTTENNEKIQEFLQISDFNKLIKESLKILFNDTALFKTTTTTETDNILKKAAYYVLLIAIHHGCFESIKHCARELLKDEQHQAFNNFFASENQNISGQHILRSNQSSKYFSDLTLYFDAEKSLNPLDNIAKNIKTFSTEEQTLFSKLFDCEFKKAKETLDSLIQAFIWVKFSSLKTKAEADKVQAKADKVKASADKAEKAKKQADGKISHADKKIKEAVSFLEKTAKITLITSGTGSISNLDTKDGAMVVGLGVAAVCTILYLGNKIRLSILQIPFIKKHFDEKAEKAKAKKEALKKPKVSGLKTPQ